MAHIATALAQAALKAPLGKMCFVDSWWALAGVNSTHIGHFRHLAAMHPTGHSFGAMT
jgi:hypothetical protein